MATQKLQSIGDNFLVGLAAGQRGVQQRIANRERRKQANEVALDQAAEIGTKEGIFKKDSEDALVIGDNFLMEGPVADNVRKTFFNNSSMVKGFKFTNKDGTIDQAKLNNFISTEGGRVALELERPDGKLVPATENATTEPNDPVVTLPGEAIKTLLSSAMTEFNVKREPGYYNRVRSTYAMAGLGADAKEIKDLEADKVMFDRLQAGEANNIDPVEMRNIIIDRLNAEFDAANEKDDFASDPRDGASSIVEPGDNLSNRIVSAATGTGTTLPPEQSESTMTEEERMNTPYTTMVGKSLVNAAKTGAQGIAAGANSVVEITKAVWGATPSDIENLVSNAKADVKEGFPAAVAAIGNSAAVLMNKAKGSDNNIKQLRDLTAEIERLETLSPSVQGTNRWKALYAQSNSKKDKLLAQGYRLDQQLSSEKTKIAVAAKLVEEEPGKNSSVKKGEVESATLVMQDFEAQLNEHLKNPSAADLNEYIKIKSAALLKEKGITNYEELIKTKKLNFQEKKVAIRNMAFEAYKQFQEARTPTEASNLYGANGPAYYKSMYQDLVNGEVGITADTINDNILAAQKFVFEQDKFSNTLQKEQTALIEEGGDDYQTFTNNLYPNGLNAPDLNSGKFKGSYQKLINNVKKFQIQRQKTPNAPVSPAEAAAYNAYQQATDEVLIQIAAKIHQDKWIWQRDFHWLGFADGSHGASELAIGGSRLKVGPDVVNGSMRGVTLSDGGELEINRNQIEAIMGDGAVAQLQEYAKFFDSIGYYASHIERK